MYAILNLGLELVLVLFNPISLPDQSIVAFQQVIIIIVIIDLFVYALHPIKVELIYYGPHTFTIVNIK